MTTRPLVLAATLLVVGSLPVLAQDPIRDRDVKFTAEVALRRNPALFDTRFDLDVSGGRVVVEGTVRTMRVRLRREHFVLLHRAAQLATRNDAIAVRVDALRSKGLRSIERVKNRRGLCARKAKAKLGATLLI